MARICARCATRFPGAWGWRLYWCKVDAFYVCRRCWEMGCREGHGRGVKSVRFQVSGGALALGFLLVSALPVVGLLLAEYATMDAFAATPPTPIANVTAGSTVKVVGALQGWTDVALGGHEVRGRNSWSWRWNASDVFEIRDGSGSILVVVHRWWKIEDGPRYAPYAEHTDGTIYGTGDRAVIYGTVVLDSLGRPHLEARIVAPEDRPPGPPPLTPPLVGGLLGILLLGGTLVARSSSRRRRSHERATGGRAFQDIRFLHESRDSSLDWRRNGRPLRLGQRVAVLAVLGSILAAALWAFRGWADMHTFSDDAFVAVLLVIFPGMLLLLGAAWAVFGSEVPTHVAFTDRGFHLWYDSPYERRVRDDFIPWEQIVAIEERRSGKSRYWALKRTTGEEENLSFLKAENRTRLIQEWGKRRSS